MGLKPPLNKSRTLNDDPLEYGGGGGFVHLNYSERQKCGPASVVPPTLCKEGGTGEGRSFGEGPRDKAERRNVVSLRALVVTAQLRGGSQTGIRKALAFGHGGINVV